MGMGFSIHPFTFIDPKKVVGTARCQRVGKCFCPSRTPQRVGITRDAGHHSRLCNLLYCSPALHALLAPRAVPVGTTRAGTIDPGSKGCASHTSGFDPLTGDRAALQRSGRCSAMQVRFKTAPLVSGSRPVASIEGLALDPLITSLRHCVRHRGLTWRRAVVERRHCQLRCQ